MDSPAENKKTPHPWLLPGVQGPYFLHKRCFCSKKVRKQVIRAFTTGYGIISIQAGLLTSGSSRSDPPSRGLYCQAVSGFLIWAVPGYSGGSVPEFHGIPYSPVPFCEPVSPRAQAPEFLVYYSRELAYVKDNFPSWEIPATRLEPLRFQGDTPQHPNQRMDFTMIFRALIFFLCLFAGTGISHGKTLTDATGRAVQIPKGPLRVVSLAPSLTEIVYALDMGDRLCGVTRYSDYPKKAQKLPRVGSYIKLELERIVRLKPDICLAVKDGNPPKTIERIRNFGIPVFVVNPEGIETILSSILAIGKAIGAEEKAKSVTSTMARRLAAIDETIRHAPSRPKLFFQIGISPIVSVGRGTFLDEMIHRAGAENAVQSQTPYPRFSTEQVLALAPEMIIITSMARDDIFSEVKKTWESWPSLPAVQKKAIHLVNSDILDRPTPRVVDGLEMLAKLIHPTLFEKAVP